jgi:hypothetical protein
MTDKIIQPIPDSQYNRALPGIYLRPAERRRMAAVLEKILPKIMDRALEEEISSLLEILYDSSRRV